MKHFTLFLTINLLVMILHNHNIVLPGTNPYLQCTHVSQKCHILIELKLQSQTAISTNRQRRKG